MCLFEEEEAEGGNHGYYSGQSHALELYRAYDDGCAGEAGDEGYSGEDEVLGLGVVHFLFNQHTDTRCGDEAEEEYAYAAHNRSRDGVDDSGYFSDEGEENSEEGCAADYVGTVYTGDGHNAMFSP